MRDFLRTLVEILLRPKVFFEGISESHPVSDALKFLTKLFIASAIFCPIIAGISSGLNFGAILSFLMNLPAFIFALLSALAVFIFSVIGIFIVVIVMHIFVFIVRGKGGFSGTFSVFVYSNAIQMLMFPAAAALFFFSKGQLLGSSIMAGARVVPLLLLLWMLIIQMLGYREIHKMGFVRSIIAIIAPPIVALVLAVYLFISLSASVPAQEGMPKQLREIIQTLNIVRAKALATALSLPKTGIVPAQAPEAVSGISWKSDLNEAIDEAKASGSPVMIDFYTDWCGWCKKLDAETYQSAEIVKLAKRFICVKINGDKDSAIAMKYGIIAYPAIIFLKPDGSEDSRINGFVDHIALENAMESLLTKPSFEQPEVPPPDAQAGKVPELSLKSLIKKSGEAAKTVKYRMQGIVGTPTGYAAVINDNIVKVHEKVDGARVVRVTKNKAVLVDENGKEIVLVP